jgi:hypothetical protein
MPTLEMIRLRSAMPNSGLLTLRYPLPPLNPVNVPDLPGPALDEVQNRADAEDHSDDELDAVIESQAEKGGDAR